MITKSKLFSIILLLFTLMTLISSCQMSSEPLSRTGFYFDTIIEITLYDTNDMTILDECMNICDKYEKMLSSHVSDSDISIINKSKGNPVTVSDNTIELLNIALQYATLSNGAFDPTIGSVSSLWNFETEDHIIPDPVAISNALSHVNYNNILINDSQVTLKDTETKIELGAIAKGYIADMLKEYLISQNIKSGIINLGGNVLLIGSRPDGSNFNVGIQKPFGANQEVSATISAADKSIVSSGVYERYFEKDGKLYHHILDTSTGYPVDNGIYGITIISDSSVIGDALSTTCFILGLDKGMDLVEKTEGIEAMFITSDQEIHTSSGFDSYMLNRN